jgi:hypothetical protein
MTVALTEAPKPVLNASHRCDACGSSRAYVAVILRRSERLPNGGELLFCGHDWREVADAIIPYVSALVDETSQLTMHVKDDGHV